MMSREIAHFFWEGEISALEISAIRSFCKHGFDVYVWSYNGLEVEGTTSKDASELLPKDFLDKLNLTSVLSIFSKTGKWSVHAGILRLEIVNKYNGWWFDTDCFCLKDQSSFKEMRKDLSFFTGVETCFDDGTKKYASGAFYASGRLASLLLQRGRDVIIRSEQYRWGSVGPILFTKFVEDCGLAADMGDINVFYAINYEEMDFLLDPDKLDSGLRKIENSYVSHVWDAMLTNKCDIDKNHLPSGSLLEHLVEKNK